MNTSTLPQTRLDRMKELVALLLDDLSQTSRIILMEQLQIINESTDYMQDVMEAQLEAVLRDYGIEI